MHKNIAAVITMGAVGLLSLPAQAQSGLGVSSSAGVRSFLPVEAQYASAIQAYGPKGLEGETAPGFVMRYGHERWAGRAAFAHFYSYVEGIQGGKVAVTIRRLTITGKTAVVLTRELLTFPPMTVGGLTATATAPFYVKQTWQRTGQGWKLAALEPTSEKALGPAPPIEYTVYADSRSLRTEAASPSPQTL